MKKLFSLLLAMLMLLTPVLSIAEEAEVSLHQAAIDAGRKVETTITFSDLPADMSGDAQVDAIINDLVNALAIKVTEQGDEGMFALNLSGADVLTLGGAVSGDDLYVKTNLLGDTVVISADEVQPLIIRFVDLFADMGLIEADDAAEVKEMIPPLFDEFKKALEAELAQQQMTLENLEKMNFTAFTDLLPLLTDDIKTEEVTGQTKNSDPAKTVITITLTPDDLKAAVVACLQFIKDNPSLTEAVAAQAAMDGEEVDVVATVDEGIAALKDETLFAKDTVITIYLDENEAPVLMDATLYIANTVFDENGAESIEEVPLSANYVRLTAAEGVTHTVNFIAEEVSMTLQAIGKDNGMNLTFDVAADGTIISVAFTWEEADAQNLWSLMFNVSDANETINFGLKGTSESTVNGVDFTSKDVVVVEVMEQPMVTITVTSASAEAAPSIMAGTVVRPAELTDEDFVTWFQGVIVTLQSVAGTALMSLPESVLMQMLGGE